MAKTSGIHVGNTAREFITTETSGTTQPGAVPRWSAVLGGGALAVYGLTRRSPGGIALATAGGVVAYLGARSNNLQREPIAWSSVLLNCSPREAYRFWRDFENLPLFMRHLESVTVLDERRSRWIAVGPLGKKIQWDAEIVNEREGELITWRSLPGSDIEVDGFVQFRPATANRGTILFAKVHYRTPKGAVAVALAKILGKDPGFLMRQDLRRMKALIETGEIPTIEGQTHGPRSAVAAVARVADRDQPIRGDVEISELFRAKRRVA
jgi:uncharacterized membrane protein